MDFDFDFCTLLKTQTIQVERNKYLFIMYYYHKDKDKKKSFYTCKARLDFINNWNFILDNDILLDAPAEPFRLAQLGLNDDMPLYYDKRILNQSMALRLFRKKFRGNKIHTMDMFINGFKMKHSIKRGKDKYRQGAFVTRSSKPYLRYYTKLGDINGNKVDITDVFNLELSVWYESFKEMHFKRRPPKVINF